jgi:hypothetical protein
MTVSGTPTPRAYELRQPQPWERQPRETEQAWEAFRTYRDLEPPRRNADVARRLGKAEAVMSRWSRRHRWHERVAAWENEQDREFRATMAAERREVVRRHVRVARIAQAKALERLTRIDASQLSAAEVVRLLEFASKTERELYGLDGADDGPPAGGLQIFIDSRTLPAGFRADAADVTDRRLVIDAEE